ncbi:GNAT family N-acetyltransferase [Diaminobutyricibacter tongyongensis]|uniref:GNAT family N-acetyltransferase n=1 Tax=Leifsonia tongyongensis TaxID=1268043 RepID=UPI0018780765
MGYEADDDPARLDLGVIWTFLSTEAYWHRWRTRADVEKQVGNAWRVVGVYEEESGDQVGFARAISDGVSDAYLADVFVLAAHRGRGLGKLLVSTMIDEGPGRNFRWVLFTADAHGLYRKYGFRAADDKALVRMEPPSPGLHPSTS